MRGFLVLAVASLVSLVAAAPSGGASPNGPKVAPDLGCSLSQPSITPTLPPDMALPDQADANCLAWQEFVALNWRAAPNACGVPDPAIGPSQFGTPNDMSPVVWETYEAQSQVFKPHAAAPDPWCGGQPLPDAIRKAPGGGELEPTSRRGFKTLVLDSKFAAVGEPLFLQQFNQAFPDDAWLTAQNGHLTMYEIRLNQDEFNYIDRNKLYDANVQKTFVLTEGINLPDGTTADGKTGSIEVKAAWIELDDPSLYPSFKTSKAIVKYPGDPTPHEVVVGLVGLHIIHKTALAQQFVWATFEHVGLDPTAAEVKSKTYSPPYVYFNRDCVPSTDHYHCVPNTAPSSSDPHNAPLQVERTYPISSGGGDDIAGLNAAMWQLIGKSNPNSVFLNYQLVDVLWPNNNTQIPAASTVPLPQGDPQPIPSQRPVANTSLETYIQDRTCLYCHMDAPISSAQARPVLRILKPRPAGSPSTTTTTTPTYASDYSFLFVLADAGPSGGGFPTIPVIGGIIGGLCLTAGGLAYYRRRLRGSG
jgi:hypothetical protein